MNLGDRKNRTTASFCRWLAMGIAVTALGCASRPVTLGQTQIGQGRLYQSGSVTYDRFFQDTHAVQLQAMSAEEDEAAARAPLEKALDAKGATLDKLYELAVGRAKKGDEGPPLLICTVTGLEPAKDGADGKAEAPAKGSESKKVSVNVTGADGGPPSGDLKTLAKALADTAKAEADIVEKFSPVVVKASQMVTVADDLSMSVDKEFSVRKTRKDVAQELAAAKLILEATSERSREVSQRARTFLKGLSEALKAPAAVEAPPPPPPAPEKPTKPVRSRKGGGPRPGPATSAPSDAAPAKPAPSKPAKPATEDFNP